MIGAATVIAMVPVIGVMITMEESTIGIIARHGIIVAVGMDTMTMKIVTADVADPGAAVEALNTGGGEIAAAAEAAAAAAEVAVVVVVAIVMTTGPDLGVVTAIATGSPIVTLGVVVNLTPSLRLHQSHMGRSNTR